MSTMDTLLGKLAVERMLDQALFEEVGLVDEIISILQAVYLQPEVAKLVMDRVARIHINGQKQGSLDALLESLSE